MERVLILCSMIFLCTIIACNKDDDPEPDEMGLDCDTFTDTYTSSIKSIIDTKCGTSGCHDGTNPRPQFDAYSKVFDRRSSIRSRVIAKSMPPPGASSLSQTEIDKIDCWVQNGAVE